MNHNNLERAISHSLPEILGRELIQQLLRLQNVLAEQEDDPLPVR